MYRLIVGTKDWSSWSLRAYLALMATGQPFDEVVVQLRKTDADATKAAIRKFSDAGTRAGAANRGRRRNRDGVGQSCHLRNPGRAPSRGPALAQGLGGAGAGARLCARKCIPAFPICAIS